MLNQLDTLIGFAVVMAVVSLLITIVTQMVSAFLGLRGKYLADALEAMIHKIDPTITAKVHSFGDQLSSKIEVGQQLSKWILTHPVLSDSLLPMVPNRWDRIWVIAWLRKKWRIASAIRPDELFQVLKDVAGVSPDQALAKQETAQQHADLANEALKEPAKWNEILAAAKADAESATAVAKTTASDAIEATKNVEATTDATLKQVAAKDASEKVMAAREKAKLATQAAEIATKAGCAVDDVAKVKDVAKAKDVATAKEFALQATMRAAAVKLLAALYVPPAAQVAPGGNVTKAPMTEEVAK